MLTMRRVTKATELKRFKELEGKYHYMGENHSGGDTMRLVFVEELQSDRNRVFRLVTNSSRKLQCLDLP